MSDPTIFNGNQPTGTPPVNPAATQSDDPNATLLEMILNEQGQKKYNTVQDALKGAAHAQAYIANLKQELADAKRLADEAVSAKAAKDELERTVQDLLNRQSSNSPASTTLPATLDPDKIAELVEQTLSRKSIAEQAKANQGAVVAKLTEVFGAEAEAKYKEAAAELGLSTQALDEMAAKSPKAVLKALGVDDKAVATTRPTFAPPPSAVNTAGFQPHQDSLVKRNVNTVAIGATTEDLNAEAQRARQMVEELHKQGASVADLSDPKVYFKIFK